MLDSNVALTILAINVWTDITKENNAPKHFPSKQR